MTQQNSLDDTEPTPTASGGEADGGNEEYASIRKPAGKTTAYEGIDLQVRTCQVIHLDLPWEPATLQQRNGRAVRQGNNQAVIENQEERGEGHDPTK